MDRLKSGWREAWKQIAGLSAAKKIILVALIIGGVVLARNFFFKSSNNIQYQTSQAERGTLVESVTASGTVSDTSSVAVTTQASGVVAEVYAANGDSIEAGQPLVKLTLDRESQQKQAQAYASYLAAKNSVDSASANDYSLRSSKDTAWKKFYDLATSSEYQNSDGSPREDLRNSSAVFQSAQADWLAAEAKYKNQQSVIVQSQVALNAAWLSYQQSLDTITAPLSGTVSNLNLQPGSIITSASSSSSSTNSNASTKIATIKTGGSPAIVVDLTEIDIPKVKVGNRATLTFDAFPGKTFTGRVSSIDTGGSVSSGVTSYPVTISLDVAPENLYPNMSASASVITNTKNDAVMVPNAAIQTQNGQSTVRVMQNGQIRQVEVETGLSNDTSTEIVSGIDEGENVVTGQTSAAGSSRTTSSPFGTGGFRQGGGNFRIGR